MGPNYDHKSLMASGVTVDKYNFSWRLFYWFTVGFCFILGCPLLNDWIYWPIVEVNYCKLNLEIIAISFICQHTFRLAAFPGDFSVILKHSTFSSLFYLDISNGNIIQDAAWAFQTYTKHLCQQTVYYMCTQHSFLIRIYPTTAFDQPKPHLSRTKTQTPNETEWINR